MQVVAAAVMGRLAAVGARQLPQSCTVPVQVHGRPPWFSIPQPAVHIAVPVQVAPSVVPTGREQLPPPPPVPPPVLPPVPPPVLPPVPPPVLPPLPEVVLPPVPEGALSPPEHPGTKSWAETSVTIPNPNPSTAFRVIDSSD
jgi:hypothetical protein